MMLTSLIVLFTALGCDVEYNDATTGLNPGCNFAGVCIRIFGFSMCICCAPEKFGDNICGSNWVCDRTSPSSQCYEFSSGDCSKVKHYLLVDLVIVMENRNSDIICNKMVGVGKRKNVHSIGDDLADLVQSVAKSKGWLGAIKSSGVCGKCTMEVPCAAGNKVVTSGITVTLQADFNGYYDSNCTVDFWISDEVVECVANWDYGQSAWFTWSKTMGDDLYYEVHNLLAGSSWSNTKISAVRQVLKVVTHDTILTTSPTHLPTAAPTEQPSADPTDSPTVGPTDPPTPGPTDLPTAAPTELPTSSPTNSPTFFPTDSPTAGPTDPPTAAPTHPPTASPTHSPTASPTDSPTVAPTQSPTDDPTDIPTNLPSSAPTFRPSHAPTIYPSARPTRSPTNRPTFTSSPTEVPSKSPTDEPTREPTVSALPFHRFYNKYFRDHFYTTNKKDGIREGWRYEGTECKLYATKVPGTVPLYRYYRRRRKRNYKKLSDHLYTTNPKEIGTVEKGRVGRSGYRSQGVAGYCYPAEGPGLEPLQRYHSNSRRHQNHFYECGRRKTPRGYRSEGVACYVPK